MSEGTTVPKAERYRRWIQNAVAIVESADVPVSEVSSDGLPASDGWLRYAVQLHVDRDINDTKTDTERPWLTIDHVDWMALWREFSYDEPGPYRQGHGVSLLQAAGALASSQRTPRGWDIKPCKDRILPAVEHGALVDIKAHMDTEDVVIVPAEVVDG